MEDLAQTAPFCLQFPGSREVHVGVPDPDSRSPVMEARHIRSRSPARRIESMSIVMWQVMRRLPRPFLLVLLIFALSSLARA